jgi:hypothetical protein
MKNIANTRYGKLTTTNNYETRQKGKTQIVYWECKCDCGDIIWIQGTELRRGYATSCKSTICKSKINRASKYFYQVQLSRIQDQAKRRKKSCDLTLEQLDSIFEAQDGKCYYTGDILDINYTSGYILKRSNLSIDRIDNSKGYTKDNIVLCTIRANVGRGTSTQEEFISMCRKVAAKYSKSSREEIDQTTL